MGTTGHAGITSGCAQCHADGLSFANMAPPTLVEPPTGPTGHVPVGSVACEQCHSTTNFTTFAGTVMKHAAVRGNACDSCHEYGMTWKTNSGTGLWTRPSPNHHAGQDCGGSGCHTSRDKLAIRPPAARVPAAGMTTPNRGGAAPVTATSLPAGHMTTSNTCQACHTTLAWSPVRTVDHSQVNGTCASCHNGTVARGKSSAHVASTGGCETCHTTNAWAPARFQHSANMGRACATCHNTVHAIGLPRNHVPIVQGCESCHGTLAWLPAKLDHTSLRSGCATCHNNVVDIGKPASHMTTQRDCSSCHTYPDWEASSFKHVTAAWPGAHRAALSCVACHKTNSDQMVYSSPANAGTCAGCHAKDFRGELHSKTAKGEKYSANELSNCTGACHVYSDSTRSTVVKSIPGPRHRVTDATFRH